MPGPVIRDFIPQGEELTAAEKARLKGTAAIRTGGSRPDFVPDEDHKLAPPSGSEEQKEEALQRALDRQEHFAAQEYEVAKERLKAWNVAEAITAIQTMPLRIAEMYLVAEKNAGARVSILNQFPEPDPAVVEQYTK